MKNLSNLKGAKTLSRTEKRSISGGYSSGQCTQKGSRCCQTYPSGFVLCEPGLCDQTPSGGQGYGCFWF
ncbi:MAG: hypothetical protein AB8G15_11280 [Saprospiraceae bacterium]